MTPFEYVIVLISIILGLGITTILTGIANLIKQSGQVKHYIPYFIWILLIFILHIHEWWVSYSLRAIEIWHLPMFLFLILYPINLYVLAHLLFPSDDSNDPKAFYFLNYSRFFVGAIILDILSIIQNVLVSELPFKSQLIQLTVLVALTSILIFKIKNEKVHYVVAIILLAIMLASLIYTTDTLVIKSI